MNIESLLRDEIQGEFEGLKDLEMGSETYKTSVEGLTKLVDRAIEYEKLNAESDAKLDDRENDRELKTRQMDEDKKDRMVRNGISIASILIPTAVTIWGTLKSFKFEETGNVTTIMGRGFIQKLLPKK